MSGAFAGFSDADIKNVQNGLPVQKQTNAGGKQLKFAIKSNRSGKPTVRFADSHLNNVMDIPDEAKLSKPEVDLEPKAEVTEFKLTPEPQLEEETKIDQSNVNSNSISNTNQTETKLNAEDLQNRQKLVEEQNRRRKELISKALADKRKRTQEETQRLNEIQIEFKKLDTVLSNDVRLLRKKIEIASIDYMETQKRYLKIEKAFLDAKLALHQKLEKKELLTEHLSKIIEQNEERKAEKLTELLNKLDVVNISNEKSDNKTTDQ